MILPVYKFTYFKHDSGSEANKAFLENINEFPILKRFPFFKAVMLVFYKLIVEDLVKVFSK